MSALLPELTQFVIDSLKLEDRRAEDIDPSAPLFGGGLGLDSIDALELTQALAKTYGVEIKAEDEKNREIFGSLEALALYVEKNRQR